MLIVYSGLIALAMVIIFAALKLAEFRENGLRRAQGLRDEQVRPQFFHPGGDLRVAGFRVEIIGSDDAADVRSDELFPQQPRDPAVTAAPHSVDVQNGLHFAKIRLFPYFCELELGFKHASI